MVKILRLDHLVLTVADIEKSLQFYCETLGMEHIIFREDRHAAKFGNQKINFHAKGKFTENVAKAPTTGSADLCFISDTPINDICEELKRKGVKIELGPIERSGAIGAIRSVYFRDPDLNLIEVSNYL